VIREVAGRFAAGIRPVDVLGRYGGEEFAVLLPDVDSRTAVAVAERLRLAVAATPVPTRSGPLDVTVSLGLASLTDADRSLESLLARADQALYRAKDHGRDRVETAV